MRGFLACLVHADGPSYGVKKLTILECGDARKEPILTMHKYRIAPRQEAWYTHGDDGSPNYNPFAKSRLRRTCDEEHASRKLSVVHIQPPHDAPKQSNTSLHEVWSPGRREDDTPSLLKTSYERYLSRIGSTQIPRAWKIIYLRDDLGFFKELHWLYHLDFQRQKLKFVEWSLGDSHTSSATHKIFWAAQLDRNNSLTRTAFGLEYPTIRDTVWPRTARISSIRTAFGFKYPTIRDRIWPGTARRNKSKALPEAPVDLIELQRLSLYLQLRHPIDQDPGNGTNDASKVVQPNNHYLTENSIIIFHPTQHLSLSGELLPGDEPWHQLVEDVNSSKSHADHPIALAVIQMLFEAVSSRWEDYILSMHKRIIALEEKIYQNPAEDAQATALWNVSRQILQAKRLLMSHIQLLETVQDRLAFLITFESQESTELKQHIEEYQRLGTLIEEVLKKPNEHIIDLMYKSVSIRDARQSLELNNSLWRLSWITFIFLPLTFLVGFFGMNVDTFQQNPSLKWYFVAAVPLMVFVLFAWLATRQWMRKDVNLLQAMRKVFRLRSKNPEVVYPDC